MLRAWLESARRTASMRRVADRMETTRVARSSGVSSAACGRMPGGVVAAEAAISTGRDRGEGRPRIARGPGGRNTASRRAWLLRLAAAVLVVTAAGGARADVVPPEAVEVADGWFRLVDRGDVEPAIARYAEAGSAAALRRRFASARPRRQPVLRSIRAWRGHGNGDSLQMEPGGFFALAYDAIAADGTVGIDEIRMRPDGRGGWRIVDVAHDGDAITARR